MARKPKNTNIDIRQAARAFDEQAFVDGVFNDDYILVVGSGVILRICLGGTAVPSVLTLTT